MPSEVGPEGRGKKLTCRGLWKIYGPSPQEALSMLTDKADGRSDWREYLRASGHVAAIAGVSFEVWEGEIFVIMGLSGSGKSTTVRCLSRLVEPTAGEILLDGEDLLQSSQRELIELRRHRMGMVFQNFGLLPHLTILQNVAFPLKAQGLPKAERESRAREMIALVELEGREAYLPHELSGGQQQRVGIARSLAANPELWFLDEPFSALDPLIRRQMQNEFIRLQQKLKKTIVFITHDFLEALRLADRLAIMKDGQIVQLGTPEDIVLNPASSYVAEFVSDVPLARVIRVAKAMEPPIEELAAPIVRADMSLEEAIPFFAGRPERLAVVDGGGQIVGSLTARGVLQAIAGEQLCAA